MRLAPPTKSVHASSRYKEEKEILPRRLLLLHNFSSLFVSKSFCVITGTCIENLLIGLLFLIILREPSYVRDIESIHTKHLRVLSYEAQVAAYGGIWCLLLICDCLLALFAQQQLIRATNLLVQSIENHAVERFLRTPTVLSESSEEGAELDLNTDEESILNPIREELSDVIESEREEEKKRLSQVVHSTQDDVESFHPLQHRGTGAYRAAILLREEPRLVIDPPFLRFVAWQVISSGFIGIPAWCVPDVVTAINVWLIDIMNYPDAPYYLDSLPPFILAFGSLFIATIVVIMVNRSFIRQRQKELDEIQREEEAEEKRILLSVTRSSTSRSSTSSTHSHLLRGRKNVKTFSQFAAANILSSLGFAVGMSFEMLIDSLAEDWVATSYVLEVLTAAVTIITVAFIQWKYLDTSYDPTISADFLTNIKRFISMSLSFQVAWSIKYAVIDTKDLLLSFAEPTSPLVQLTTPTPIDVSSSNLSVPLNHTESPLVIDANVSSFAFLNVLGGAAISDFIHLPLAGEFFVAVFCMIFFGGIVGLLSLWQNNVSRVRQQIRYRKHFVKLVILACGTVIGWSWAVFFGVVYEKVTTWFPASSPWWSGKTSY